MSERYDRRGLLWRAGGLAALSGFATLGYRLESHDHFQEFMYQDFINREALRCADQCGEEELPFPLAFDVSTKPYKLVIPSVAKAGFPGIGDGKDIRFLPMLANGEVLPPKLERLNWSEMLYTPIFKGPSNKPLVALTIDDGYEARGEILQTIIEKKVSATFLIIGDIMESDPDFIRKADETGLITWGDHTKTHRLNFATATKEQIKAEMNSAEATLQRLVGKTTKPVGRPPGGTRSTQGIEALAELKWGTMLWNTSGDAGTQWTSENPWALAKWYLDQLKAMKNPWGSIILLHFRKSTGIFTKNGKPSGEGPSALALIIDGIRDLGIEPSSVDRVFAQAA